VEVDQTRLIQWLQALIRIPSITGNEAAIARYVADEVRRLGYEPTIEADNVYFETGSGPKSLLLNAHLDTVDLAGTWKHDPYGGELEDGKIYGRGASDNKGNIAALLEIARIAKTKSFAGRLIFTFTTGEEFGAVLETKGSYLLSQHLRADKALVLEPQFDVAAKRLNIIHGCRGIENIKVRVKGKASHTGYPERGINAIGRAVQILARLDGIDWHKVSVQGQEIKTFCMPIQISGGADIFLVPAECTILLHARTAPEDDRIVKQIESLCREVCGDDFSIETPYSAPGYIDSAQDDLLDVIRQECQKGACVTETRFAGGRIDASIFKNVAQIPSFCIGVGDRDQMHLVDEYITVADFLSCAEVLKNIVFAYMS
jgi:acetylornithine deacetylase/succinyl-diaminopimelate desuccinylase-like protein